MTEENTEGIDYKAVVEQLQSENEKLRERLTASTLTSPISDALDSMIVVIKQSDPMRIYIWACIFFIAVSSLVQVLEMIFK